MNKKWKIKTMRFRRELEREAAHGTHYDDNGETAPGFGGNSVPAICQWTGSHWDVLQRSRGQSDGAMMWLSYVFCLGFWW